MKSLTDKQAKILDWIIVQTKENLYQPSIREICDHFNMTVKGASDHVRAIEAKGYVTKNHRQSRALIINSDSNGRPVKWSNGKKNGG